MRNTFDAQLEILNNELAKMGALTAHAIESASAALINKDVSAAEKAIAFDREVDKKERDIEQMCLKLLMLQQPVASDLRQISSALRIIANMERIGDQAADISELIIYLSGKPYIKTIEHLPQMAKAAISMVRGSVDAFIKKDIGLAKKCILTDDIIDDLFVIVKDELVDFIRADKDMSEQAADMLLIAKYFERIGDHAQNIAEWVEYFITGKHKGEFL